MSAILAIDPGCTESAYITIDAATRRPLGFGKIPNAELLKHLGFLDLAPFGGVEPGPCAIEMVASYGMAVGAEVFETCVWIGRFLEAIRRYRFDRLEPDLVKRHPVKMHHCHHAGAKDSNITQALVDRFAPGQPNRGKGTKAAPGWFHGFAADVWQAYALAVYVADQLDPDTGGGCPF